MMLKIKGMALLSLLMAGSCASHQPHSPLDTILSEGDWDADLQALRSWGADPRAQFEQGFLLMLKGVEKVFQDLDRYGIGAQPETAGLVQGPFSWSRPRISETVTYEQVRRILTDFRDSLERASDHLASGGHGTWKVPLRPGSIRLDLNGDGIRSEGEALGKVVSWFHRGIGDQAQSLDLALDPGDSLWLAGYTRLVSGVLDLVLIYDLKPLYLALGKESFPTATDIPADGRNDALGTLEHLKASEPTNGERARQSFLRVSDLSFQTWQSISAETDNDREWLPNPKQTSALGLRVSEERIQDWLGFMKDWNDLLEDRKRLGVGEGSRALSLKKWFQNPPDIQDALSLQEKYWEETTKDRILDGNRTFERYLAGDNLYYALWFN